MSATARGLPPWPSVQLLLALGCSLLLLGPAGCLGSSDPDRPDRGVGRLDAGGPSADASPAVDAGWPGSDVQPGLDEGRSVDLGTPQPDSGSPLDAAATDLGDPGTDGGTPPPPDYDVIVVGAGTGGTMAAIQAARLGARVALLEETDWLGGQLTAAAVSTMDEGGFNIDSGLYAEFIARAADHYRSRGKSMNTCYFGGGFRCLEAAVGRRLLEELVAAEPGITLFYRTRVVAAQISEPAGELLRVSGVVIRQADGAAPRERTLTAGVVVDATEYGDLLPLTPARYRVANRVSDAPDPAACVQDITYTAVIRRYHQGVPADLQPAQPPPGYGPELADRFRRTVSAPNGLDWREQYGAYPVDWPTHNSYRGVPDSASPGTYSGNQWEQISRTGVNWANDHPYTTRALEDRAERQRVHCEAKLLTLQFLWYVWEVLGERDWSLADDEGFDSPYNLEENRCEEIPAAYRPLEQFLPPIPYIRESRRVIGLTTLTASDIRREGFPASAQTNLPHSLGLGDYAVDLHGCNSNPDLEPELESTADVPPGFRGGPFQIPFEVFVPVATDGLLVAEKNLSVSRLAAGALREQPVTMLTGQAAGALAALAVRFGVQPRHVSPLRVQRVLVDAGVRLSLRQFTDVPHWHPAWATVELVATRGLMVGYGDGTFDLAGTLTRGQAAVVLVNLLGLQPGPGPAVPTFADLPANHYAYAAVEELAARGIVTGCELEPRRYCPERPTTRAEFAVLLARGLALPLEQAPPEPRFTDVPPAHWAFPALQALAAAGLVEPCQADPPRYCPDEPLLRGDTARFLVKVLLFRED